MPPPADQTWSLDLFRYVAAAMMTGIGLVLLLPGLQARFAAAGGLFATWMDHGFGSEHDTGIAGQVGVGVLLGAVWSPCVGPTLGGDKSEMASETRLDCSR